MSETLTPVLAPVTRALTGARRPRRSDQRWEVTNADINMYAMIVGRAPSEAERLAALTGVDADGNPIPRPSPERRDEDTRLAGRSWSPAVMFTYLRGLCVGTIELRGGPQFSGWVRQLSMQARQRIQETQVRLAAPKAR
jgi:hypothetical protein